MPHLKHYQVGKPSEYQHKLRLQTNTQFSELQGYLTHITILSHLWLMKEITVCFCSKLHDSFLWKIRDNNSLNQIFMFEMMIFSQSFKFSNTFQLCKLEDWRKYLRNNSRQALISKLFGMKSIKEILLKYLNFGE